MNIWLSLLIFNPLEALVIFWILWLLNPKTRNNKFSFFKNIGSCYLLGTINYLFQSIPNLFDSTVVSLLMMCFVCFLVLPVILCLYSGRSLKECFIAYMILNISVLALSILISVILNSSCGVGTHDTLAGEILANSIIKIIQFLIIFIVKRSLDYEKSIKKSI